MIVILQANNCGAKLHKKLYTAMPVIIYFVEESKKGREFCISLSEQFGQLEEFR